MSHEATPATDQRRPYRHRVMSLNQIRDWIACVGGGPQQRHARNLPKWNPADTA